MYTTYTKPKDIRVATKGLNTIIRITALEAPKTISKASFIILEEL